MRKVIIFACLLLVMLAGLLLGPAIAEYKGYILIVMENGTLQMSVFGSIIFLIFVTVGLWVLFWLGRKILRLLSGSQHWLGSWSERKKHKAFTQGLFALAEGNFLEARKQLSKIADTDDFDGLNLLASADTEIKLNQPEKAREFWRLATTYSKASLAANIHLIDDYLQNEQTAQALSRLEKLDAKIQNHPVVVRKWTQALAQAGKWKTLKEKLNGWKKILGEDYDYWMQQASKGRFAEIASKEGALQLKQNWQNLPRATRKDPAQQAAYVQQLIDQGMHQDAEAALVEYQKSEPHPLLLPLMKQLKLPNPAAAIKKVEGWLKQDNQNVELLSTLGHLAFHAKDLVLASKVLNSAIKLGNRKEDILLMARIKESQHDNQQAMELYKLSNSTN